MEDRQGVRLTDAVKGRPGRVFGVLVAAFLIGLVLAMLGIATAWTFVAVGVFVAVVVVLALRTDFFKSH